MEVYNVRQLSYHLAYRMVKFDSDFNVLAIYVLINTRRGNYNCTCFQKDKPDCRHRWMLSLFFHENKVNSGWFYDYDNRAWERPIYDPIRAMRQARRVK